MSSLADLPESKSAEVLGYEHEIFFKIGASMYSEDVANASKVNEELKSDESITNTSMSSATTTANPFANTNNNHVKFNQDRTIGLLCGAVVFLLILNVIQYHYMKSWRDRFHLQSSVSSDIEYKLNETLTHLSTCNASLNANRLFVDNCWIRAELGECVYHFYEKSAEEVLYAFDGMDTYLVSPVVDAFKSAGNSIQNATETFTAGMFSDEKSSGKKSTGSCETTQLLTDITNNISSALNSMGTEFLEGAEVLGKMASRAQDDVVQTLGMVGNEITDSVNTFQSDIIEGTELLGKFIIKAHDDVAISLADGYTNFINYLNGWK